MDKQIKDVRRRLAALATGSVDASSSPATALADCRVVQSRLRELKREILARIAAERAELSDEARESLRGRPSLKDDWRRRQEGAKKLLADVQERVIGLVDSKRGKALEAWSDLSEEIDARLAQLEELESRLAREAGARQTARRPPPVPPPPEAEDDHGDDLYAAAGAPARPPRPDAADAGGGALSAAVGATVRKQGRSAAYCPHCGQGIDSDDRFCRRCGHRLKDE